MSQKVPVNGFKWVKNTSKIDEEFIKNYHEYNEYNDDFDNGGKNMTFVMGNGKVYDKYNEIWEVIRKLLKVKFAVNPVRDDKYLVAKLKIFNKINRTTLKLKIKIIFL